MGRPARRLHHELVGGALQQGVAELVTRLGAFLLQPQDLGADQLIEHLRQFAVTLVQQLPEKLAREGAPDAGGWLRPSIRDRVSCSTNSGLPSARVTTWFSTSSESVLAPGTDWASSIHSAAERGASWMTLSAFGRPTGPAPGRMVTRNRMGEPATR